MQSCKSSNGVVDGLARGMGRPRLSRCLARSCESLSIRCSGRIGVFGISTWLIISACSLVYACIPSIGAVSSAFEIAGADAEIGVADRLSRKTMMRSRPPVRAAKCWIRCIDSGNFAASISVAASSRTRSLRVTEALLLLPSAGSSSWISRS